MSSTVLIRNHGKKQEGVSPTGWTDWIGEEKSRVLRPRDRGGRAQKGSNLEGMELSSLISIKKQGEIGGRVMQRKGELIKEKEVRESG